MKLGESTATVVFHRLLYVLGFLLCTALALFLLVTQGAIRAAALYELAVIPVISIIALVVLLALSLNPRRLGPLLNRFLQLAEPLFKLVRRQVRLRGKADEFLRDYHTGFRRILASKLHVFASFLASLGDWACSVLILWFVVLALGFNVSLWVIMVTMAIGKMIQMTPIAIPGMLGVYEAAVTASLALFAVPVAVAASAALLLRVVTTWLDLPVTGLAAYHYGYKFLFG